MARAGFNKILFFVANIAKEMWVRCCIYCLVALTPFLFGPSLTPFIPSFLLDIFSSDALLKILIVLASSMLAVTTFSLSIMVQALNTASITTTPRASKLLMQHSVSQNVLGAFIGSFLFSIVGIVGLSTKIYSEGTIAVFFILTLVMILFVVIMLLQWIRQLSELGRVSVTIKLIEETTQEAISSHTSQEVRQVLPLKHSYDELKESMHPLVIDRIGHIQYIDYADINKMLTEHRFSVYITATTGDFVDNALPFVFTSSEISQPIASQLSQAVVIGKERTFNQDPRYGFLLLTEIALRALSPGVNDPGTAVDAMHAQLRVFDAWVKNINLHKGGTNDLTLNKPCDADLRLYVEQTSVSKILEDMFLPLLNDIKTHMFVCHKLMAVLKSMKALCNKDDIEYVDFWHDRLKQSVKAEFNADDFDYIVNGNANKFR